MHIIFIEVLYNNSRRVTQYWKSHLVTEIMFHMFKFLYFFKIIVLFWIYFLVYRILFEFEICKKSKNVSQDLMYNTEK